MKIFSTLMPARQFLLGLLVASLISTGLQAAGPRVMEQGQLPADARLGELKHLNDYFPFQPPKTKAAWEARAEQLRRRILVASGLWPMPPKTPLNAVIHGKVERNGFTVEKVYFESAPGFFVTGLLFRPEKTEGEHPAVLSPHGHGGRLQDHGEAAIKGLIESGDEKYEGSGRYPKLSRCAQLARMGVVTFIFDMLGYADSTQVPMAVAHRLQNARPDMENSESWGLFSSQAELRLQSIMGLQTWNSIRALDFLCALPDVDAKRVAVTGSSGGGTQSILLGAIDERLIASFPQGMVSTAMQGGCTCENMVLLRIGTGNIELAGLFAPRPQAMTGANDWTKEIMTKGYPQLQQLYKLYGVPENVYCKAYLHFGHNYNYVTRGVMYHWFNRHMNLNLDEPIVEEDYQPLVGTDVTIWNDEHPEPPGGPAFERRLTKQLDDQSNDTIRYKVENSQKPMEEVRKIVGGAVAAIVGRSLPETADLEREKIVEVKADGYLVFTDKLRYKPAGEEIPVVSLFPVEPEWNGTVTIWIDGAGKDGMFGEDGKPVKDVTALLQAGHSVMSADLVYQGEFLKPGEKFTEARKVANPRAVAAFTYGYNDTVFVQRVHDILTLIAFAKDEEHGAKEIQLAGVNGAGPLVAVARLQAGESVTQCLIDTGGFRFTSLSSHRDPRFMPGAVKYFDLPGLLATGAPQPLCLVGEGSETPPLIGLVYEFAGAQEQVTTRSSRSEAISWLTE